MGNQSNSQSHNQREQQLDAPELAHDRGTHDTETTEAEHNGVEILSLAELGLASELYFSVCYDDVKIAKSGLLAKLKKKTESLDIDIACALYTENNHLYDLVWYKKLRDKAESVCHYGDELTGIKPERPVKQVSEVSSDTNADSGVTDTTDEKSQATTNNQKDAHNESNKANNAPQSSANELDKSKQEPTNQTPTNQTPKKPKKKNSYRYKLPVRTELETIKINLMATPKLVTKIVLLVSSFQNAAMNKATQGKIEVKDSEGNTAIYLDFSSIPVDCRSLKLATLEWIDGNWCLKPEYIKLDHASLDILADTMSTKPDMEQTEQ